MSSTAAMTKHQGACLFKASMYPIACLKIFTYELDHILATVIQKKRQAPDMFQDTPIILDVSEVDCQNIPWAALTAGLRQIGICPIAVQGISVEQQKTIGKFGLAYMSQPSTKMPTEKPIVKKTLTHHSHLVIKNPIRSGQQIYARSGDLIVVAPVSCGAELLAEGHIHVYGPLRGRALAGCLGNEKSCIFCTSLEAELISIAGHYALQDQFYENFWQKSVIITCQEQQLNIQEIANKY